MAAGKGFVISKLEGKGGELWIGKSAKAADLVSWVAIPGESPGSWRFSGVIGERDSYLMTQGPDAVVIESKMLLAGLEASAVAARRPEDFVPKRLRWAGTLEIAGNSVKATFAGPPEER